jgi:ATP synthase F1 delta subunit
MENFNQIFTLLANKEGIGLNLDILETGLLNIIALLAILVYTGRDFLGSLLEERKTTIVKSVQDAEDRLSEAQNRLSEAQKQLDQAQVVISEIKTETIATKKALLESDAHEARKDLKIRFDRALATFRSKERQIFLNESSEFTQYLGNPIVNQTAKREVLTKVLEPQINTETFKFLLVLVNRDRINLLGSIISNYLELVYETASIKMVEVSTAFAFTNLQKNTLIKKLKELTNAREIRLVISVDSSLIGGFLIKTESKIIDFTIKNQLQKLAKHLDAVLEI